MVKEIRPAGIPRCIRRMAFSITVLFPAVCCGQNPLRVELSTIAEGNTDWDWMQARTAYVPLNPRQWLTTMSRTSKIGSHGYHDVYVSISANSGVCRISDGESWLTVAEGRVSDGERRGEVNNVILANITQQSSWPSTSGAESVGMSATLCWTTCTLGSRLISAGRP